MKKILILGSPGAGKSTISRELSDILQIDIIHMDQLFWKPGWESITTQELEEKLKTILPLEQWIIDGNYANTLDMRLKACDTVIFLDYSLIHCLYGVFKRRIMYHKRKRSDITEGCDENINLEFLLYVIKFPFVQRKEVYEKINAYTDEKDIFIFKNRQGLKAFVTDVRHRSSWR